MGSIRRLGLRAARLALVLATVAPPAAAQGGSGTLVVGTASTLRQLSNALQAGSVPLVAAQIFASPLRFDADWTPQPYLAQSGSFQDDGRSLLL